MQKTLPAFLAILGICSAAVAQEAPAYVPTPEPAAASEPNRPGILKRIFGSRQQRPLVARPPAPAPQIAAATPAPARPKAKVAPKPKPKIAKAKAPLKKKSAPKSMPAAAEPDPAVARNDEPAAASEKPEPAAPPAPASVKKTRKGKGTPVTTAQDGVEPPPDADPETKEKFRFDQAKAKASADPEVMELKAKADGAVTDEDARSAQRAYNKALFGKMRQLDSSLDERINSMEAAILKRLDVK